MVALETHFIGAVVERRLLSSGAGPDPPLGASTADQLGLPQNA